MSRKGTSRFGLAVSTLFILAVLCRPDIANAVTISPSPSTTGSYTVTWNAPLGCDYFTDGYALWAECRVGYEIRAADGWEVGFDSAAQQSFSGKPLGTYIYEVRYNTYSIEDGVYWIQTSGVETSASVEVTGPVVTPPPPPPNTGPVWSLTDASRRAYLRYYSPVIFKRADEDRVTNTRRQKKHGLIKELGASGPALASVNSLAMFAGQTLVGGSASIGGLLGGILGPEAAVLGSTAGVTLAVNAMRDVTSDILLNFQPGGLDADWGFDWITNYYFDGNNSFNDNSRNWKNIGRYVTTKVSTEGGAGFLLWDIRPTLYTAAIEFMEGDSKELVLIYHIYHAMNENAANEAGGEIFDHSYPTADKTQSIHDWERVEIHIKNIQRDVPPGSPGEQVFRTVITQHKRDLVRPGDEGNVHYLQTASGKHLMLFQAEWSARLDGEINGSFQYVGEPHGQELRYVEDSWETVHQQMQATASPGWENRWGGSQQPIAGYLNAKVHVQGESNAKEVHYIFVLDDATETVKLLNAFKITRPDSALALVSAHDRDDATHWYDVPRLQYELQDLADIFPTHAASQNSFGNWWGPAKTIRMYDPITSEEDATHAVHEELGTGDIEFLVGSSDVLEPNNQGTRSGIPVKAWWWGCYDQQQNVGLGSSSFCGDNSYLDSNNLTRLGAHIYGSYYVDQLSTTAFHLQHDYFVHTSASSARDAQWRQPGHFLTGGWHKPERGGWDGRYVQLFDDHLRPLTVVFSDPVDYCSLPNSGYYGEAIIEATGGVGPYQFTWGDPLNEDQSTGYYLDRLFGYDSGDVPVTVRSTDGQEVSISFPTYRRCPEPPYY